MHWEWGTLTVVLLGLALCGHYETIPAYFSDLHCSPTMKYSQLLTQILCCTFQTIMLIVMFIEVFVVMVRQKSHLRITRALRPVFFIDTALMGGVRRWVLAIGWPFSLIKYYFVMQSSSSNISEPETDYWCSSSSLVYYSLFFSCG